MHHGLGLFGVVEPVGPEIDLATGSQHLDQIQFIPIPVLIQGFKHRARGSSV